MVRAKRTNRSAEYPEVPENMASDDGDFVDEIKSEIDSIKAHTSTSSAKSRNRVESLRERMQLFYGNTDEDLLRAIKLRAKWGDILFSLKEDELNILEGGTPLPVNSAILSSLKSIDVANKYPGHSCIVDGTQLNPNDTRVCEKVAVILNVGYSIITLDWSFTNLLAVSVRITTDAPINSPALFSTAEAPTAIYVYSVDKTAAKLLGSIQGNYGAAVSIKWRPFSSELFMVFGNGQAGIVSIDQNFSGVMELDLNCIQPLESPATCACWRTTEDVILGYSDGHFAEFSVTNTGKPNFVARAHSSVITQLATGWPDYPLTIFTSSVDGWSCVFRTIEDLRQVHKAPRLKHFSPCSCYSPAADSFVSLEDFDTTKIVPWRKPELVQAQTAMTRHSSGISSVAASASHPLIISGGQDGEIHIANPLRRTMVTRRNRDIHMNATIWRFECSQKSLEYRFVDILKSSTLPKRKLPDHLPIYPTPVSISSISWQPNSTWYAAGTSAGIIRIETVDA